MSTTEEKRYDVVIIDDETRTIAAVIGTNLTEPQALRRQDTGFERINSDYDVVLVPAGDYIKGNIVPAKPCAS